jgi:hypothetical protein
MPIFSDDDVTNFMVTEAVVHRVAVERVRENKHKEVRAKLKDHKQFAKDAGLINHGGR